MPAESGSSSDEPRPFPAPLVRALAQSGRRCTPFLRGGSGRPVLILTGIVAPLSRGTQAIVSALASWNRVIIAEHVVALGDGSAPVNGADFNVWFAEFLDAVGIERARVVALGAYAHRLAGFAPLAPTRLDRVVMLLDESEPVHEGVALGDQLRAVSVSAMVVRWRAAEDPGEAQMAAIRAFLADEVPR